MSQQQICNDDEWFFENKAELERGRLLKAEQQYHEYKAECECDEFELGTTR